MTTPWAAAGAVAVGAGSALGAEEAGAGAVAVAVAAGADAGNSVRRLRLILAEPSTSWIAVRSYRFIRRTSWWITRTSKGGVGVGCVGFSGMLRLRGRHSSDWAATGSADPHRVERFRDVGQDLATVVGHQHVVLDPDAAPAGQIDAGLDGDHHAGLELDVGAHA